jgi:hypothetical protein
MMEDGKVSRIIMGTGVGSAKPRILLTGPPGTRLSHFAFLLGEQFHHFFYVLCNCALFI